MKVIVDFSLCKSHGKCMELCPEVFELQEDGTLLLLDENPGDDLEDKVVAAAQGCPEGAIALED